MNKPTKRPDVRGVSLDAHTRCAHYHLPVDIIAIKLPCCGEYWACHACHEELAGHDLEPWTNADYNSLAVLCGLCGTELTIAEYMVSDSKCPACNAKFNEGCKYHSDMYFGEQRSAG